jgi:hypothetical protein
MPPPVLSFVKYVLYPELPPRGSLRTAGRMLHYSVFGFREGLAAAGFFLCGGRPWCEQRPA